MVRPTDDVGPLLGALLRGSHHALVAAISRRLGELGYSSSLAQYGAVVRPLWDHPSGVRATELARLARMTKQSMGAIVDQLEADGFVERVDDPDDRRARLVRYTKRGQELGRVTRDIVRRVELDWAKRIGKERIATVREALTALLRSLEIDV